MDRPERLPGLALAEQTRCDHRGVGREQPEQLAADIAGGTKDRGSNHHCALIAELAILCKYMHKTCMKDSRARRHRVIAELLRGGTLSSQEELVERLRALGFEVTQATASRDLEQLGAIKIRRSGTIGYALPDQLGSADWAAQRLRTITREWVGSVVAVGQLVVLKTPPGSAHLVGVALDQVQWPEVAGTICGDDTLFVALADPDTAQRVAERLRALLEG